MVGVGPTGALNPSKNSGDPFNCYFHDLLDGSASELGLESAEVSPVVYQGQTDGAHSNRDPCLLSSINQFDHGHFGGVAKSLADPDDSGVATRAIDESWSQDIKELLDDLSVE